MKTFSVIFLLFLCCACFNSCLKDVKLQKYTYYTPVFDLKSEVRAAIKGSAPQSISLPGKIYVQGNYIFINELGKGIHIVDYSQPSAPQNVSFIPIPGNENLTIQGNYLYADEYSDLLTIDIENPLEAKLVNVSLNAFTNIYYSYGGDSTHIITSWRRVDTMVKGNPEIIRYPYPIYLTDDFFQSAAYNSAASNKFSSGGSMASFTTLNNHLYTVSAYSNINIFDLKKASSPAFVQTITAPAEFIETLYPFENNLFVGCNSGVLIFNASNPDNLVAAGSFGHVTACDPVIAENNIAYATLRSGSTCMGDNNELNVLNTSNLNNPTLIKAYSLANPRGLSKDGNNLFVCDGGDGLKIMNAADANNITLTKTVAGFEANDVILNNGLAIVTAVDGLYLVDYSNISNASVVGKINITR